MNRRDEEDLKDLVRKARHSSDKTGALRKKALEKLIDLATGDSSLKIFAAQNIREFFSDFPQLQEQAIHAVYDICEGHSTDIRIEGFRAITHISRADSKYVKRNADVLLQLMQSEDAKEANVVKEALVEHIDLDPQVTLTVLGDPLLSPEDSIEDQEEVALRERLRSLVLAFFSGDARDSIIRHATPGSEVEKELVDSLISAIPKLENGESQAIIQNLLLHLPTFKTRSPHGKALLNAILNMAKVTVAADLEKGGTLATSRSNLDLASAAVTKYNIAPPLPLLRFYYTAFAPKTVSHKLAADDLAFMVLHFGKALKACDENANDQSPSSTSMRKQAVDASRTFFERLHAVHSKMSETAQVQALSGCALLLKSCLRRKEEGWTVPPHFQVAIQSLAQCLPKTRGPHANEVQALIRSLAHSDKPASTPQPEAFPSKSISTQVSPPSPHQASPPKPERRIMSIATSSRAPEPVKHGSTVSNKRDLDRDTSPRALKKAKTDVSDQRDIHRSLLSRLGASDNHQGNGRRPPIAPRQDSAPQGFSIKGAARKEASQQEVETTSTTMSTPLLERLRAGNAMGRR